MGLMRWPPAPMVPEETKAWPLIAQVSAAVWQFESSVPR